jgi:ABC-type uncharacterized transport system ATPase subunit
MITATTPSAPAPMLTLEGITKHFGPVAANQDIRLDIAAGEIHTLLGENGAGKSTLMSILAGRYRPDAGVILLKGKAVDFSSPAQALAHGIGMVYQRFMLIEPLTVAENILLGTTGRSLRLPLDAAVAKIRALSERFGLAIDPRKRIWQLSMGERQRVEILKLLFRQASILILDEPTAVLTPSEVDALFDTLRELARQGRTIVFISHKLDEVLRLSDRISIMRQGRVIASLPPDRIRSKRELARLMVGREIVLNVDKPPLAPGPTVLGVAGLRATDRRGHRAFDRIGFTVRRGEILALTGVAGNGQEPLVAALMGLAEFDSGRIEWNGRTHDAATWRRASRRGMVYIPEDRHLTGSVADLSMVDNYLLTRWADFRRGPVLDHRRAAAATAEAAAAFRIHAPAGIGTPAGQLSGGNLQKLLLARELLRRPLLIVAEHPTQGLDIRATEEVWQTLLHQRDRAGILLVSGDLKEVLALADRVAVMFRGRILRIISTADSSQVAEIGLLMAGVTGEEAR